jgi:hypothetical protein
MADILVSAATGVSVRSSPSTGLTPISVSASSAISVSHSAAASSPGPLVVSAASAISVSHVALGPRSRVISVSAESSISAATSTGPDVGSLYSPSVSTAVALGDAASSSRSGPASVSASSFSTVTGASSASLNTSFVVFASTSLSVSDAAGESSDGNQPAASATTISSTATITMDRAAGVSSATTVAGTASASRAISVSAASSLSVSQSASPPQGPRAVAAATATTVATTASAAIGYTGVQSSVSLASVATARVEWEGGSSEGGDLPGGPRTLLSTTAPKSHPFSQAEVPSGDVLLASGVGPMLRWSPSRQSLSTAGVASPLSAPSASGSGLGPLTGDRIAWCRFIDDRGRASAPGPFVAFNLGADGLEESVEVSSSGLVYLRSVTPHGIVRSANIMLSGIYGVGDGVHSVTAVDDWTVLLNDMASPATTPGIWPGGGSWSTGSASVTYTSVPVSTDPKVRRRQVLRSLEGTADCFYVDIDTDDLAATSFSSSLTDDALAGRESVPMPPPGNYESSPWRHSAPPSDKAAVCSHLGTLFAAGHHAYSVGHVTTIAGLPLVAVVAGDWGDWCVGRVLSVFGDSADYEVTAWDGTLMVATLDRPFPSSRKYAAYSLSPPPAERKSVRYSEPDDPESWPPWNAVSVPSGGDEPVGLYSAGSHLYVVCRRRTYRLAYSGSVGQTASLSLSARRGCVNHRCVVVAETAAFLLDESGAWAATQDDLSQPISAPIQSVFTGMDAAPVTVNWSADRTLWHGSYDPAFGVVRWFVHVVGRAALDTAICYHSRTKAWWFEQYPWEVTSSAEAEVVGRSRAVAGVDLRRIAVLWEGSEDSAPTGGPRRGVVAFNAIASGLVLTDAAASFPGDMAGCPVVLTDKDGNTETALVSSATSTTITFVRPVSLSPASGSVEYRVGGVPWRWRGPWLEHSDDQSGNPRDLEIVHSPTSGPASITAVMRYDHDESPRAWGYGSSDDGVSSSESSPAFTIDLARTGPRPGYALKRLEGHQDVYAYGDLFASVAISGVQGGEVVRVYGLTVRGASEGGRQ